ncbi:MAG: hypothetical protein K2Y23_21770 [Cyanobacteria bacterium]|nr:hypothetical protein [Cyanobacteriota bacterium]
MNRRFCIIVFGSIVLSATTALARQAPPLSSGPLVVERIQSGWLFSPDVRATDLGGETGALAGGYLGRITDRTWVIGAGGYFLTNRDDDFKMAYGGAVVEWLIRADRKIGFGVRTLVGAGTATLPRPASDFVDPRRLASTRLSRGHQTGPRPIDVNATIPINDDFFVAEPQVNAMWNLSAGQRLVFGLGYRVVGSAPLLRDQLNGLSGSVSFQIGGK